MTLKIGRVEIDNPFVAAPMAGITDLIGRWIYKSMGASLVFTEMVSGKGLLYKNKNTEELLKLSPKDDPVAYQIFGGDPEIMACAADLLNSRQNDILDINMGCPVPKVVKNGEGSALLKDLDRIHRVVESVVQNSKKPVTVKIRSGWDEDTIVAVEAARAVEAAGGSGITVHARTRQQYYKGKSDWDIIKKVKSSVNIPVIGNGDVFCGKDGMKMLEETGCDMVMIGRGMLGNPWIFREAVALWKGEDLPGIPDRKEKIDMLLTHIKMLTAEKGEYVAVREIRKQVGWYLKGEPGATAIRRRVNEAKRVGDIEEILFSKI